MSLSVIRATINCDRCAKQFRVELDPATRTKDGLSLSDYADEAVAAGDIVDEILSCSIDNGRHLCSTCTDEVYAETGHEDEDFDL